MRNRTCLEIIKPMICLISLLIIISGVLSARVIEKEGNPKIKKLISGQKDLYIGVSLPQESLQQAFDNALSHAQTQIIEDLGVKTKVEIKILDNQFESGNQSGSKQSVQKTVIINGTFHLSIRPEQIYWEKQQNNGTISFVAYTAVSFSKTQFKKQIDQAYQNILIRNPYNPSNDLSQDYRNLISLFKTILDFEKEYSNFSALLSSEIYTQYQNYKFSIEEKLTDYIRNTSIILMNSDEKFPDFLYIYVSCANKPLDRFPVYTKIKEENLRVTDAEGMLKVKTEIIHGPVYNHDFYLFNYPDFQTLKIIEPRLICHVKSPLYNQNINLFLSVESTIGKEFKGLLEDRLLKMGFQLSEEKISDFKIVINPEILSVKPSALKWDARLKLTVSLTNMKSGELVTQLSFPDSRFKDFSFIGDSKKEAVGNAFNLEQMPDRNEFVYYVTTEISKQIKRQASLHNAK